MKCTKCEKESVEGCVDTHCPLMQKLEDIENKSENDIGVLDESDDFQEENGGQTENL